MSRSSDRPVGDLAADRLARVLTASQVLAVVAVVIGLVLSPPGGDGSVRSLPHMATLLGILALLVGPFLGLAAVAGGSTRGSASWFAWGAVFVAAVGAVFAAVW